MENFNLRYFKPKIFISTCIFSGILLYVSNKYISTHWGISFSIFSAITILFVIIEKYLWKYKPFSYMYTVPNFSGRYEGTLRYQYRDDNCELITGVLKHIKVITQTGSNIVVRSWTQKDDGTLSSESRSIEASIVKEKDGSYTLIYNYLNDGSTIQSFAPHYGTEVIKLEETKSGKMLVGRYYTERLPFQTKGEISLNNVGKK